MCIQVLLLVWFHWPFRFYKVPPGLGKHVLFSNHLHPRLQERGSLDFTSTPHLPTFDSLHLWPLIGRGRSRDLNSALWLVHHTWLEHEWHGVNSLAPWHQGGQGVQGGGRQGDAEDPGGQEDGPAAGPGGRGGGHHEVGGHHRVTLSDWSEQITCSKYCTLIGPFFIIFDDSMSLTRWSLSGPMLKRSSRETPSCPPWTPEPRSSRLAQVSLSNRGGVKRKKIKFFFQNYFNFDAMQKKEFLLF